MAKKHGFVLDNVRYEELGDATEALVQTKDNLLILTLFDQGEQIHRGKVGELILSNINNVHKFPDFAAVEIAFNKATTCYVEEDAKGIPGVVCGEFDALREIKSQPRLPEPTWKRNFAPGLSKAIQANRERLGMPRQPRE